MTTPIKLDGILVKIEAEYGTDPTPTIGDDAVRIADRLWPNLRVEHVFLNTRENSASGTLGAPAPGIPYGGIVSLTIPIEMKGAGAAYGAGSLPPMDPLLRSCGLARTDTFTTSVSYSPHNTTHASCTIWAYADGNVYKIVGCRGTLRWPITPGETNVMIFEMQGLLSGAPTVSALGALTYAATLPPAAVGMACTIGGVAAASVILQSAELVLGAQVQRVDSGNAADGIKKFAISGFEPRITANIETVALATYNPYTVLTGRTSTAIDWTVGSAQYNRCDLDVDAGWLVNDPAPEVVNDFCHWGLEYGCEPDELALVFD